ncbi:MAG: Bro-N domain-containing protein [Saprospiraceae bacterium]|nr:Bro-N domain-containing protein [Saprospiraceae bacterium]
MEKDNYLAPFEGKKIRRIWHDEQWYFSVVDIIEVLTDSPIPKTYWSKLKTKIKAESQTYPNTVRLKLVASDGRNRLTDCANTEGVLRIVMSVPSPKAEPLKLWLAQVGKERIEETENPELLRKRQTELYRTKGYSEEWIQRRVQSIDTRNELTEEWQKRGVVEGKEYSILTATIAKGTFGLTPSEHKKLKGLDNQELRDHMTPMELILTALSEEVTRTVAIKNDAQGFYENHEAAIKGGQAGKRARQNVEKITGEKVVSEQNFLHLSPSSVVNELPADSNEETDESIK